MRSTLHHSSPQIFSLAVYRLRGDCKSPGFIGRTFFTADCKSAGTPHGCKSAGTPDGRQTPDGSVRNPWSKNALLTQRNPMKKYPGEEWVKSGEELSQLFTSRNPSVYRGFRRFGEE